MRAEMQQAQKDNMLAQILTAVRPPASPSSETELEPVPEVEAEPEEMEESKKGEKSSKDDQKKRGKKKRWCFGMQYVDVRFMLLLHQPQYIIMSMSCVLV